METGFCRSALRYRILFLLLVLALTSIGHVNTAVAGSQTLTLRHIRTIKNEQPITSIVWHPNGQQVAVSQGLNPRVFVWSVKTGRLVREISEGTGSAHAPLFSPDGKILAVGRGFTRTTKDQVHVHIYDADSGALLHGFVPPASKGGSSDVMDLAFSPDSRLLAASAYGSRYTGVVYDVVSRKAVAELPDPQGVEKKNVIEALAFSPQGQFLAVGRIGGQIDIWSTGKWKLLKRLEAQTGGVDALAFSPDGARMASGTNIGERWDRTQKPHRQKFDRFSDDIVLWSVPTFNKAKEFPSRHFKQTPASSIIENLQFSPDGKFLLVSARAGSLEIINLDSGTTAFFKDGYGAVVEASLSPDGKHIALGLNKKIEIYELIAR